MAIENRNLEVGTRLVANYKKQTYVCTVEAEGDGITFVLEDGKRFKSPSAAAVAITKVAQNGWRFWSLEGEATASTEAEPETVKTEKPRSGKRKKLIYKIPNQAGTPAGNQKFFCVGCCASFLADDGETPAACPKGHTPESLAELAQGAVAGPEEATE